jgi:O-antigen/teichoic acid export membrane protein
VRGGLARVGSRRAGGGSTGLSRGAAMSSSPAVALPAGPSHAHVSAATRKHLRGSSLLFAGRLLSLGVNFATQVLIARYLSKSDMGVFAYGLALAAMGQSIAVLGLDKAVARFLPIYDERGEPHKVVGGLILTIGSVLGLGAAIVAFVAGFHGIVAGSVAGSSAGLTVLLIMVLLAPLQALDDVLLATFAVFSRPKAIFVRKYVLAPVLRLGAIVVVIATQGGVASLATGYVVGGVIGIAAYTAMLGTTLRSSGVLAGVRLRSIRFPAREIYAFALPLVFVDLLHVVANTSNVIILGNFGTSSEVADYRVVLPAAHLNLLMMQSFGLLFTPLAARLFARQDRVGIEDLYWRTAAWIAVLSFPVFAATTGSAYAMTVLLFGAKYSDSAAIMALLSLGYYFSAALGFNGLTLRVFGLVRYSVVISVCAAVFNVAIALVLIPMWGALGAGIATCATFIVHNILKQAGLRRGTGIRVLHPDYLRIYLVIIVTSISLVAIVSVLHPGPIVALGIVAIASIVVLLLARETLRVGDMFPELLRSPLLRRVFG